MIQSFPPTHSPGKPCPYQYAPDGKTHEHGDVWGAGLCPQNGNNPGGPMYEWVCLNGVINFNPICQLPSAGPNSACVNGAPHGAGYNIGKCSLTNGGPLSTWTCYNGILSYTNPCYEAYQQQSMSQSYSTPNVQSIVILAVDYLLGVYLVNGQYLSSNNHGFSTADLSQEMERQGHHQWVMYGFPEEPIESIDYQNTIQFEDGVTLTQDQHQMTSGAMSNLRDLLK